ncbi:chemotaxis-specific protein-glutamate methyltransferase CheB [Candidatus Magnetaquicoccus inordinatus]|uniref:chemotaxis-specific protein-glutamate methyltransferase CheB n=1 Tax=Candidatus Magnetaquicoccus inordinatus TaxID=2496818 RepID=UPI00102CF0F8|nr:chemotaxis-specific protein-glutamate methyltransferase CheB [Candidatus Magnetaquicoccus inordinatus]
MTTAPLRVMVVDDTTTYRMIVRQSAEAVPGVEVVDFAANGRIALDKLGRIPVDVVLLDVEMPEMNGLDTLHHITAHYPHVTVVMVSGASHTNADIVVECLNSGAFDFVTKPLESDMDRSKGALLASLRPILSLLARRGRRSPGQGVMAAAAPGLASATASRAPTSSLSTRSALPTASEAPAVVENRDRSWPSLTSFAKSPTPALNDPPPPRTMAPLRPQRVATARPLPEKEIRPVSAVATSAAGAWDKKPSLLLIGSSTGGPAALTRVLSAIPPGLPIPTMIVQHMPPMFTVSLAAQLARSTGHNVLEAAHDQEVEPGKILLAPGGRHLSVKRQGSILKTVLNDGPKVNGCRPAVDVLFMSVMASFSEPVLAVILTGMGNDGANGVKGLKRSGKTYCLTQSRESCVVYGMPRVVEEMGLSDESIPLEQMGAKISELCR